MTVQINQLSGCSGRGSERNACADLPVLILSYGPGFGNLDCCAFNHAG